MSVRNADLTTRFAIAAIALGVAAGCGDSLFSASSDSGMAGMAGATQPSAGSAGIAGANGGTAGADTSPPGGESSGGVSSAGSAAAGGVGEIGGIGGETVGVNPLMALCATYGDNAGYNTSNEHCYLAVKQLLAFDAARQHCAVLGAHLATISDAAENAYVWKLNPTDHWLGASDGKLEAASGSGKYAWLTGEAFLYQAWVPGQPNAATYMCSTGACYEHCLVHWGHGQTPGEWNDNGCSEALESVCEWDK